MCPVRDALFVVAWLSVLPSCVTQPDYRPPANHPAAVSAASADPHPPGAADPFAIEARPIDAAADVPHDHGSMNHGSMDHSGMNHGSVDHGGMNGGDMQDGGGENNAEAAPPAHQHDGGH